MTGEMDKSQCPILTASLPFHLYRSLLMIEEDRRQRRRGRREKEEEGARGRWVIMAFDCKDGGGPGVPCERMVSNRKGGGGAGAAQGGRWRQRRGCPTFLPMLIIFCLPLINQRAGVPPVMKTLNHRVYI